MAIFSGINIALQIYVLTIALFYVRSKSILYPDKGYQMWKHLSVFFLVLLGIAIYTFVSLQRLSGVIYLTLSIETDALDMLVFCLFYLRPRYLADRSLTKLGNWKLITIFSIIIAGITLLIPFVFTL